MKKIFLVAAIVATSIFSSCTGPEGPRGVAGPDAEVFELRNVDFSLDSNNEYTIYEELNPQILLSDTILIYRLSGTIDSQTPIWQQIPRTLYLTGGELDYDFDFSKVDFTIYAGGTYPLTASSSYINNQTFRIVIIPGYLSNKGTKPTVNFEDYNAVVKAYHIDESKIKTLN